MVQPQFTVEAIVGGEKRTIVRRSIYAPSLDREVLNIDDLGIKVTGVNFSDPEGVEVVLRLKPNH